MDRRLRAASAVFWVAGLAAAIVGMNIKSDVGSWMTTIGSVVFFIGLLLQGVVWARAAREKSRVTPAPPEKQPDEKQPDESKETGE